MKSSPIPTIGLAMAASIACLTTTRAVVNIDYVPIGNAGNAADTNGRGAVAYEYSIGQYEVTNSQYTEFLNAADPSGANPNGIYNASMGSNAVGGITYNAAAASGSKYTVRANMGNKPVNFVSWYDSARFVNWLQNGQGSGSTETGAYTLSGNTGIILKNVSATIWLPSEDEWYKAAYYDPTPGAGGGDNYWLYATQSDTTPTVAAANATGDVSNPGSNVVNYSAGADWNAQNGNVTTVGSAAANNYFGTFDQGGNVYEWNDGVFSTQRGLRGGAWTSGTGTIGSSGTFNNLPTLEGVTAGFRVAGVPEPGSIVLSLLACGGILRRSRRSF